MLCVSIKPDNLADLRDQLRDASLVGDLVEIRVDGLPEADHCGVSMAVADCRIPTLLTLRSRSQGGDWSGSAGERQSVLQRLARMNPDYLDVEATIDSQCVAQLQADYPDLKLVVSHHVMDCTPDDLTEVLAAMRRTPATVYKLVATANSTNDALRMLAFTKSAGRDVIGLCMGEPGQITRILSGWAANPWTYCALADDRATAPGQLSARELVDVYNYRSIEPDTVLCGLIGDPTSYSVSQHTHNAVYRALDINAAYIKMRVRPDELHAFIPLATALGIRGLSVTIPHKEKVQPFLREIEPVAVAMGAVNTLSFEGDGIHGRNTDAAGALDAIERHGAVDGLHIVILGAGGAARAVAYEAKQRGARVTVLARRSEQWQALVQAFGVDGGDLDTMPLVAEAGYDVLVNATPSEMPISAEHLLPKTLVMDLKNKPKDTEVLVAAQAIGCRIVYGLEMFVRQAVGQIHTWFGSGVADADHLLHTFEQALPQ